MTSLVWPSEIFHYMFKMAVLRDLLAQRVSEQG